MWEYDGPCLPVSRTDVAAIWAQVARIRERSGDREGAARARRNAKIMTGVRLACHADMARVRQSRLPGV